MGLAYHGHTNDGLSTYVCARIGKFLLVMLCV